eukprot:scaffold13271_cov110-Cylindrotheca_fusiformis.AAC.6
MNAQTVRLNGMPHRSALTHCNTNNMKMDASELLFRLDPTPINRERIVPVEKVNLNATSWNLDEKSLECLRELSMPSKESTGKSDFPRSNSSTLTNPDSCPDVSSDGSNSFRQSQVDLWNLRYTELVKFHRNHGHCLVPLRFPQNSSLSHWVKRQRYQYRVKSEGKHSTLDDDRQAALEALGFVWDSHSASWEERWNELHDFRIAFGHTNVPKTYKANPQLGIWVKSRKYIACRNLGYTTLGSEAHSSVRTSERRHYRLHCQGKKSTMSKARIEKLLSLGFLFNPRSQKTDSSDFLLI